MITVHYMIDSIIHDPIKRRLLFFDEKDNKQTFVRGKCKKRSRKRYLKFHRRKIQWKYSIRVRVLFEMSIKLKHFTFKFLSNLVQLF
jgi:hypothetical protein